MVTQCRRGGLDFTFVARCSWAPASAGNGGPWEYTYERSSVAIGTLRTISRVSRQALRNAAFLNYYNHR